MKGTVASIASLASVNRSVVLMVAGVETGAGVCSSNPPQPTNVIIKSAAIKAKTVTRYPHRIRRSIANDSNIRFNLSFLIIHLNIRLMQHVIQHLIERAIQHFDAMADAD